MHTDRLRSYAPALVALFIALASVIPQSINMFGYPYYEADEGTYMAQAQSLMLHGKLAPYTYWYDHAPFGWMQIGAWSMLTGGFNAFGFSINSGRVFMLVLHGLSTLLLLGIGQKMFRSSIPALIAIVVFSLSPLAVHYHRRVLLDNIMTFWMLLSLYLVLGEKRRLYHYAGSAVAFGLAFLSKEAIVYLTPAMLIVVVLNARRYRTQFPVILWVLLVGITVGYYPMYALLQGELFPTGHFLGGDTPHVSLLEALSFQNGRGGGFFLNADSSFMFNMRIWLESDAALIVAGVIGTFVVALLAVVKAELRPLALLTLFYWFFLVRGGIVIVFYIVPLVPLIALSIGATVYYGLSLLMYPMRQPILRRSFATATVALVAAAYCRIYLSATPIYALDQTANQLKAIEYVRDHIPPDAFILTDMYAFIELRQVVAESHYYWRVDRDPEINEGILGGTWCNIDYVLATPQLTYDASVQGLPITQSAYDNSLPLATFAGAQWDIQIRQIDKSQCPAVAIRDNTPPEAETS